MCWRIFLFLYLNNCFNKCFCVTIHVLIENKLAISAYDEGSIFFWLFMQKAFCVSTHETIRNVNEELFGLRSHHDLLYIHISYHYML